jgi:hypothetical protein
MRASQHLFKLLVPITVVHEQAVTNGQVKAGTMSFKSWFSHISNPGPLEILLILRQSLARPCRNAQLQCPALSNLAAVSQRECMCNLSWPKFVQNTVYNHLSLIHTLTHIHEQTHIHLLKERQVSSIHFLQTQTHLHIKTSTCKHTHTHTHARTHARTHAHAHTHAHTHAYTQTHTHTQMPSKRAQLRLNTREHKSSLPVCQCIHVHTCACPCAHTRAHAFTHEATK